MVALLIRTKRRDKSDDGFFHIDGRVYKLLEGTRSDVWNGNAYKTSGGLIKNDLLVNKDGKIVSKSKSIEGTINNKLALICTVLGLCEIVELDVINIIIIDLLK